MPVNPCRNKVTCEGCDDPPVLNLSAEATDRNEFRGRSPGSPYNPPISQSFDSQGCLALCTSEVSQEEADICAQRQSVICEQVPPPPGPDDGVDNGGGGGGTGGGNPPSGIVYASAAQTCDVFCPDGTQFTAFLAAGTVLSPFSQEDADSRAQALCLQQAEGKRICFQTPALPGVCFGSPVSITFVAVGGTAPITYFIDPGQIPTGMAFDGATGILSGTPATVGEYLISIQATDSADPPNSNSRFYTLYVAQITTASPLPAATPGVAYSTTLAATGAPAAHTWEVTSGSLPPGLSLNPLTGVISGTTTFSGAYSFEVTLGGVGEILGPICTKEFSLTVQSLSVPCGFFEPCSIGKGTKGVSYIGGSIATWTALDEGAYQVVYADGIYDMGQFGCALPDPPEQRYGLFNFPEPAGNSPLAYYLNVPASTYLPTQNPYTEIYCPTFPAPQLSFHVEADAIANYHTKPMPLVFATDPVNAFSIWNHNGPPITLNGGVMSFTLVKTQQLINPQPLVLVANDAPVSKAASQFTLTYGGATTTPLSFTALAATVQAALNALAPISGQGGVVCAGSLASGMTITWNNNGDRDPITSAITTVSPSFYCAVVTTQEGTAGLPEIQRVTVAPWNSVLVNFPAPPDFPGGMPLRDLWDINTKHHWYNVSTLSYTLNPPPFQMEDIGVVDAWVSNVCGPEAPTTAPTLAIGAAGNVEAGTHSYVVAFVKTPAVSPVNHEESGPSPVATITLAVPSIVNLTNIPLGPAGTTDRYIFRTAIGQSVPRFIAALGDNTTTIYADNIPDALTMLGNPVQPASHFWDLIFEGVTDPLSAGPPYGFHDPIWRGYKNNLDTPDGRYLPYPPRPTFGPATYHDNTADGIPYYDLVGA